MKVRMKTLAAGPDGLYQPGQVVEISAAQAQAFIEAGYAEEVVLSDVERRLAKTVREMATVKPPEHEIEVEGAREHLEVLALLGIHTLEDLAGAHDGAIAKTIQGVGKATARKWIATARELLGD